MRRSASVGKWEADHYALRKAPDPTPPMPPMPKGTGADDPDAWRGEL
jgi:hypothetical protein